ncbi:unnamed protein product [Trichogramma brassicae]|uniref:Uncharacterized protein n=1 Tax=Trichogramma brassicae TaxID=86971 RepID=A0A6H5IX05_9HYME|nr:unnamed protein product [Trichogramma brassicae]
MPLSGPIVLAKAKEFSDLLNVTNFSATNAVLRDWRGKTSAVAGRCSGRERLYAVAFGYGLGLEKGSRIVAEKRLRSESGQQGWIDCSACLLPKKMRRRYKDFEDDLAVHAAAELGFVPQRRTRERIAAGKRRRSEYCRCEKHTMNDNRSMH